MEKNKSALTVELDNGVEIRVVPVEESQGFKQVSGTMHKASKVFDGIKEISKKLRQTLEDAAPDEAEVEFHVGFSAKSSDLVAIIVDAEMQGSIKVILKWKKKTETEA
jgi:hypothetical protein